MHSRTHRPRSFNTREPIVEDLREKLNRNREARAGNTEDTKNLPPPDPSYNFLKDPLRGDDCGRPKDEKSTAGKKNHNHNREVKRETNKSGYGEDGNNAKPLQIEKVPWDNRNINCEKNISTTKEPRRQFHRDTQKTYVPPSRNAQQSGSFIREKDRPPKQQSENNIKIEVSSVSGERKCTFDNTKTIQVPVIKEKNKSRPKSGKWPQRNPRKYSSSGDRQQPKDSTEEDGKNNEKQPTNSTAENKKENDKQPKHSSEKIEKNNETEEKVEEPSEKAVENNINTGNQEEQTESPEEK